MWLILQSVAAAGLAVFALVQDPPQWPSSVRAMSLGAWGSFAVYASFAVICAFLFVAPRVRASILAIFPERLASAATSLFTTTGVLVVSSMVAHVATGNVWLSPMATPLSSSNVFFYVLGGVTFSALAALFVLSVFTLGERLFLNRPTGREISRNVTLVVAAVVFTVCLFEIGLRLHAAIYPQTDGYGWTPGSRMWINRYVEINSQGFRGQEIRNDAEEVYSIAVVGDSFVFGYGIRNVDDRFTEVLEKSLNEQLRSGMPATEIRSFEVFNIARGGADTALQLQWINSFVSPARPDLVILGHVWNDIDHATRRPAASKDLSSPDNEARVEGPVRAAPMQTRSRWLSVKLWLITQSAVGAYASKAQFIMGWRRKISGDAPQGDPRLAPYRDRDAYLRHVDKIAEVGDVLRDNEIPFVVVLLPNFYNTGGSYPPGEFSEEFLEDLRERGVSAVDLLDIGPLAVEELPNLRVNANDAHPNEEAHRQIAEGMQRLVIREM